MKKGEDRYQKGFNDKRAERAQKKETWKKKEEEEEVVKVGTSRRKALIKKKKKKKKKDRAPNIVFSTELVSCDL